MLNTNRAHDLTDSDNFIRFCYVYRKHLLIVTGVALLCSVIFSSPYFIVPKYKSTVIMYPVASNSISKALLSERSDAKQDILEFGEDEQTEQMLQVLKSGQIRERVVEKYNLMEHYRIDTSKRYSKTKLIQTYEDNITFRRTEYTAVEIIVLDEDSQIAADIANDIAVMYDEVKNKMKSKRAEKAFRIVEEEYLQQKQEVRQKEDSLSSLRALGVHDYESQAEMINRQLAMEIAKGNRTGIRLLEEKLEVLARYGGPYVSLRDALEHDKKQLSLIKTKYEESKIDYEQEMTYKFVVDRAYKSERKAYPVRWLIVVISVISSFLMAMILLAIIVQVKKSSFYHISATK